MDHSQAVVQTMRNDGGPNGTRLPAEPAKHQAEHERCGKFEQEEMKYAKRAGA